MSFLPTAVDKSDVVVADAPGTGGKVATRVYLETPYSGDRKESEQVQEAQRQRNIKYAIMCMGDCLIRGEAPFASHLLYTQTPEHGMVSDFDERYQRIGRDAAINAALSWGTVADKTVVYTDLGISSGMKYGIDNAVAVGRLVEYRQIKGYVDPLLKVNISDVSKKRSRNA